MLKRISVVVDENSVKKIKKIQASMIIKSEGSVSFSHVVDILLKKALKNHR